MFKEIAILGNGNAAHFFKRQFGALGIQSLIYARNPKPGEFAIGETITADLVLICISDKAIGSVSATIPIGDYLIAHVSGSVPLQAIDSKHNHRAIFYPLMSLSNKSIANIQEVPFCLEAERAEDLLQLEKFAKLIGANSYRINSHQRQYLHLAAVLAHNFSNHLFHLAFKTLEHQGIDFSILKPILLQAVNLLQSSDPALLQTGPAIREDKDTLQKHLELIDNQETKDLYQLLTQSIQTTHGKKL